MPILQQNALVTIYLKAFLLTITSINTSYATKPDRNRRNNMITNLSLLHGHCHDELHRRCA
ncbi:UNVERIFIED_CONTAM: hypothetical protein LBW93_05995 [Wolbachia endosymbiont of Nasonia longicornis]